MLLQETERSQKDAYDGLLSPESGLSKQENKIRYVKLSYQASIIIFIFNLSDIQWYAGILSKYPTGSFINLYKAIKTTFFYMVERYIIFMFYWKKVWRIWFPGKKTGDIFVLSLNHRLSGKGILA